MSADGDAALLAWSGEVNVEMIRATFDHWRIFEADGRWCVLRSGTAFDPGGPLSLLRSALNAGSLELGMQLCMQAWLASLSEDELRDVWLQVIGAAPRQPDAPSAARSRP